MEHIEFRSAPTVGQAHGYTVDKTPDRCPLCDHAIKPIEWNAGIFLKEQNREIEQLLQCPRERCKHLFFALYVFVVENGQQFYKFTGCTPNTILNTEQSPTVTKLSPDFCSIFDQANKAEKYQLTLVAGPGYRKAFEFLIKDYAKASNPPEDKDRIEKMALGECIATYIEDERIKQIARRATWLANDEVHYIRKWIDKDLKDVKALIELTLHWIEIEHLTKQVLKDMPAPAG
jgi:hypothetical protein